MRAPRGAVESADPGRVAPRDPDDRMGHRTAGLLAAVLAISAAFAVELHWHWGGVSLAERWIDDLGELAAAGVAGALALFRSASCDGSRHRAWRWLGVSCLAWAAGEAAWSWYDLVLGVTVPFPSVADAGFLFACPAALVGVLTYLGPSATTRIRIRLLLDGLITAGALLFISWVVVLGPAARADAGHPFSQVIGLAYPLSDVVSMTVAFLALGRARGAARRTLLLIGAGLIALAVADSTFSYLNSTGSYGYGNPSDAAWVCGYLLIGLAAVSDRSVEIEIADDRPNVLQAVIPYFAVVPAAVVALLANATSRTLSPFLVCEGLAVLLLLVGRQVFTVRQNAVLFSRIEQTVGELHARERQLVEQAAHDPLTGLVNRSSVDTCVAGALEHHLVTGRPVAVLMCDLDRFKTVNDTLGHAAGDRALVEAALRLVRASRGEDVVGRVGGDEFVVVIQDLPDAEVAATLAGRLVAAFAAPFVLGERSFPIGVSIGMALLDGTGRPPSGADELLVWADRALYRAKASGRNCWMRYEGSRREAPPAGADPAAAEAVAVDPAAVDPADADPAGAV